MQQLVWSGSIPTLRNPALISQLGVIENISKFNRIHLPVSVFSFDHENPLQTFVNLANVGGADPSDEEDQQVSQSLALTRRVFYRSFGSELYEQAMDVAINYSKAAALFFVGRSSLIQPLYPSKSMVIASNLLSMLFKTLFTHMHIPDSKHSGLFDSLCSIRPLEDFETNSAGAHGLDLLLALFPANLASIKETIQETDFVDLWKHAVGSLPSINS